MSDSRADMNPERDRHNEPSALSWFRERARSKWGDSEEASRFPEKAAAHDDVGSGRSNARAHLNDLIDDLLRRALGTPGANRPSGSSVRDAVCRVCDAAHTDDVRVEELLVVLKTRWRHALEVMPPGGEALEDRFARVVTACIHEYYSPRYDR